MFSLVTNSILKRVCDVSNAVESTKALINNSKNLCGKLKIRIFENVFKSTRVLRAVGKKQENN